MLKVHIDPNLSAMRDQMNRIEREQMPFALGTALTRTAHFVAKQERAEMGRKFDRPTRFALNSVKVNPASKRKLWAEVKIRDTDDQAKPPINVIGHHIYGGSRLLKRSEQLLRQRGVLLPGYWLVPGAGARMDSKGNISRGQMQQILSALGAQVDRHANTKKGKRRNKVTKQIFAIRSAGISHLRPGVYQRVSFRLRPLLAFVRQPRYRKRLRFFEVAEQVGSMRFRIEFPLAMRQAVRFAQARGL